MRSLSKLARKIRAPQLVRLGAPHHPTCRVLVLAAVPWVWTAAGSKSTSRVWGCELLSAHTMWDAAAERVCLSVHASVHVCVVFTC